MQLRHSVTVHAVRGCSCCNDGSDVTKETTITSTELQYGAKGGQFVGNFEYFTISCRSMNSMNLMTKNYNQKHWIRQTKDPKDPSMLTIILQSQM